MLPTIKKVYTLVFVRDTVKKKILLGFKKRGFGMNKWNGLGGKVEKDESIINAAKREVEEESGLKVTDLEKIGYLEFQFEPDLNKILETHVFVATTHTGTIQETEEMRPEWFNENDIPFDHMWKDDRFWLPQVIENKYVKAYFLFKENQEDIVKQNIKIFEKSMQLIEEIRS